MSQNAENQADLSTFEGLRTELLVVAYRMLGDVARAQDMVQETWLRWSQRASGVVVESPRAYLVTAITRLCLNHLSLAHVQREELRATRLPEPARLLDLGILDPEKREEVSMACLVALERLNPIERAVFLLHDVFELPHEEIAAVVGSSEQACRKSLERARDKISAKKRMFNASREEHQRLLFAFLAAVTSGDMSQIVSVLASDAVLVADAGPHGRSVGNIRNLPGPLHGADKIAAFVIAASQVADLRAEMRELNGQPAVVFERHGEPFAALLLAIADGLIFELYFHADLSRLCHTGTTAAPTVASFESP